MRWKMMETYHFNKEVDYGWMAEVIQKSDRKAYLDKQYL